MKLYRYFINFTRRGRRMGERERERDTHTETHIEREREREREKEGERKRERDTCYTMVLMMGNQLLFWVLGSPPLLDWPLS